MNAQTKLRDSRKAYRISLRDKLSKSYQLQALAKSSVDLRWINGFMAAGYHSGLISLTELKIECLSAYRAVFKERMTEAQETRLERRLSKLCAESE